MMTVSTVVASLLPIIWSTSSGAEVMKPLATPVLGGMVSSLVHVLIVTPVIFYWLRERQVQREEKAAMRSASIGVAEAAGNELEDHEFVRGFNDAGARAPITGVFHYATFGVRLTLPVRNKNQGLIEAAVAARDAARKRREFAELVVRNEVAAAYTRLERAQAASAVYRDRVIDASTRNLDVLRQAYTLGQRNLLDYIAEQRRFIEVETSYTDLLREHFDALAEIERVAGLPPSSTEQKIKTEN